MEWFQADSIQQIVKNAVELSNAAKLAAEKENEQRAAEQDAANAAKLEHMRQSLPEPIRPYALYSRFRGSDNMLIALPECMNFTCWPTNGGGLGWYPLCDTYEGWTYSTSPDFCPLSEMIARAHSAWLTCQKPAPAPASEPEPQEWEIYLECIDEALDAEGKARAHAMETLHREFLNKVVPKAFHQFATFKGTENYLDIALNIPNVLPIRVGLRDERVAFFTNGNWDAFSFNFDETLKTVMRQAREQKARPVLVMPEQTAAEKLAGLIYHIAHEGEDQE